MMVNIYNWLHILLVNSISYHFHCGQIPLTVMTMNNDTCVPSFIHNSPVNPSSQDDRKHHCMVCEHYVIMNKQSKG